MSEAAQEDSVKAIRRELMGVRSIAGFMSSEELVKRVDTILNDLVHPSTFAAATKSIVSAPAAPVVASPSAATSVVSAPGAPVVASPSAAIFIVS